MQIGDAPAPCRAGVFMVNGVANRRSARANHLRGRAVKIGEPHAIDPLQRAEHAIAGRCHVCRCGTDKRPPGHHEDHCEVAQFRNSMAGDLRERMS
jgi:hypothetical protein